MNSESIQCSKVTFGEMQKPGDFCFDENFAHIYFWIPGRSGPDCCAIVRGEPGGHRVWGWDGNVEKPTLKPSILVPEMWHGYLRNGKLESC
jgi:hypothetical protein